MALLVLGWPLAGTSTGGVAATLIRGAAPGRRGRSGQLAGFAYAWPCDRPIVADASRRRRPCRARPPAGARRRRWPRTAALRAPVPLRSRRQARPVNDGRAGRRRRACAGAAAGPCPAAARRRRPSSRRPDRSRQQRGGAGRRGWRRRPGRRPASGPAGGWTVTRKMRARDAVADEPAQLLVQPERLAPELVERVLLRVAAQADAAAHVVDLGQVLDPQRVDGPQQDDAARPAPSRSAPTSVLAGVEARVGQLEQVLADGLAAAELPELVGGRALAGRCPSSRARSTGRRCPSRRGRRRPGGRRRGPRSPRRGSRGPSRSGPRCGGPCRARRRSSRAAC